MQHLLLLHGAIGAKKQLEPLSNRLKNKFNVHSINFSGHGGSEMPNNFSIEIFSNDVLHYLKENKIESVNIFGYSMGGYVALYLAKKYPERINKIFTFATKFLWTPDIANNEIKMLNAQKIAEKIPAFAKELESRHKPTDWRDVLEKTKNMMIDMGNRNPLSISDYTTINHNVLIGIGDKDTMVTLNETIDVYRNITNAQLVVFPNTPHPIEKINLDRLEKEIEFFFV